MMTPIATPAALASQSRKLQSRPTWAALLFVGTFVLGEAAILLAAGLAGSDKMTAGLAMGALIGGMIVSDWCLVR